METYLEALKEKLDEVSKDVKELVKISTTHNVLLDEHQKRSIQLENLVLLKEKAFEERIKPIEEDFKFRSTFKNRLVIVSTILFPLISLIIALFKFKK